MKNVYTRSFENAPPPQKLNGSRGFTLAEVLITLGIIGVVAALTMPSLIQNHKEKATVARLKKAYSVLSNAYMLALNENPDVTSWFNSIGDPENSKIFFDKIKPYLKIQKECGFEKGCLTSGYVKTLDGRDYAFYDEFTTEYRFILADGTAIWFYIDNFTNENEVGNIKVDIDGKKGAYTFGKDVFLFYITTNKIMPYGTQNTTINTNTFDYACNKSKTTHANGIGCTAWVLYNENMDYLHCNDLSWSGKVRCK